jgi:hypothetical protein
MAEKLLTLPCPFCGSMPNVKPWHGGPKRKHAVCCENDACTALPGVTGRTRAHAVRNWNTRY